MSQQTLGRRPAANGQYFSVEPACPDERRIVEVSLRGHGVRLETSRGVFSGGRLDMGTAVLLRHVPAPPETGVFLDLGCGWGPIAIAMALESPRAEVWAIDVNERAVGLASSNARRCGAGNVRAVADRDLPVGLRFDLMWSNPPIRVGKDALHALLAEYLPRLSDGGVAYLVVQRNLGSDSLMAWINRELDGFQASRYASSKGYRVLEVVRER
ncbi:MAG: class I SAM-dependent methyltransferase [Aeriscardovia sp.]|nr:class I SAM-dependent methyltransferase [Aeriscardovia sp.]